ncbi:tol-pal system-associated acyl-CoA thioesterase [Oceaniglobus trochenteri]|uniref:tol-pal system-associated acyl-CoA thioesterase n=1 Tax=Oceaniglobus trochenteri TaxID=2763260 RepID=UPI001CFF5A27|nr:tol-pal system-associated acyl-CoA thioesterase [Oceaniglobus trochenteri]
MQDDEHWFSCRVHYEDTDMGGIVYHANYLKFIERARSDWVRGLGVDQMALRARGVVFAVARIEADFLRPAQFDDILEVRTRVLRMTGARVVLAQDILCDGTVVFAAEATLVALDGAGRARRLPAEFRRT